MSGIRRPVTWVLVLTGLVIFAGVGVLVATLLRQTTAMARNTCVVTVPAISADGGDAMERYHFDTDQVRNASIISAVAMQRELPERAVVIALATAMQESKLHNLDYGDRDSLGLFQQRPSQGWGTEAQVQDPRYAAGKFFDTLVKVKNWETRPLTEAAQAVQRSGFPNAYAGWEPRSAALGSALTGSSAATLVCRPTEPTSPPTLETVRQNLASDLQVPVSDDPNSTSGFLVTTPTTADRLAHRPWTVANWAVANAGHLGITRVSVEGKVWSAQRPGWHDAKDAPSDAVLIELAPAVSR